MATPWHQAISEALWLPSRAVIVLALAVVGMRLGSIASRNAPRLDVSLTTPLICKLLLYPALMLMISLALPLPAVARQALVLQAAAPTAISVFASASKLEDSGFVQPKIGATHDPSGWHASSL